MSTPRQRFIGDILFYLQMFFAFSMGIAQALRMLTTTEGVNVTWLVFWGIFLIINLSLSYRAHQTLPSRITKQTFIVYATWTALMVGNVIVFIWQDVGIWKNIDTMTALLAGTGIAVTLLIGRLNALPISDPLIRGYLAVFFKGLPQLTLAYSVWQHGGAGLSVTAVIVGHITICTRLGQIFLSLREAGWDRNRLGSAISEIANEGSWIVVTIVWLLR